MRRVPSTSTLSVSSLRRVSVALTSCVILLTGVNSYAASRSAEATLHINVTVLAAVETQPPQDFVPATDTPSQTQSVIYNFHPVGKPSAPDAEMIVSTPPAERPKAVENLETSQEGDTVLEQTTVVMK